MGALGLPGHLLRTGSPAAPAGAGLACFSHLLPPLLDSHPHAERDHHWLLYEPPLERDFSTHTSSIRKCWSTEGSEWGEGVPVFSEPENTMFPQFTDSHRLLSGSGLSRCMLWPALALEGGEDAGDMTLQVPQRPSEQGQDGARRHVQRRIRWSREPVAAATAGSRGGSKRRGSRPMNLLESPSVIL